MSVLNGDDLVQRIAQYAILYTDKELTKHFSLDAPKVFRKCAQRIEEAYKRGKDEEANRHDQTT